MTIAEARNRSFKSSVADSPRDVPGDIRAGQWVICLQNESSTWIPCTARFVRWTGTGRATIDLYGKREERRTVTKEAIYRTASCDQYDLTPP